MKLSQYAKRAGISYKTAWRWYKAGQLDAYQTPTGMVVVRDPQFERPTSGRIALYARVSSADQKDDLERQVQRLRDYAAARGYPVAKLVTEIGSSLNDSRPKFLKLLADPTIGTIIVEYKDRGTRLGWNYITTLMEAHGRKIEAIFPDETKNDLLEDFISLITSLAARMYGRRASKRRAERIKQCVEQVMLSEDEA